MEVLLPFVPMYIVCTFFSFYIQVVYLYNIFVPLDKQSQLMTFLIAIVVRK